MTRYARVMATGQASRPMTYKLDPFDQLQRFLILGVDGNTVHATSREAVKYNAENIKQCLKLDSAKTVQQIVDCSVEGLAAKNDPAIFALAVACSDGSARKQAMEAIPKVCRTGTHLFQFMESVKTMRGFGRGLRRAIGSWYQSKSADDLAYQLVKYRNRSGYTHRDVLRLTHPVFEDAGQAAVIRWSVDPENRGPRQVVRSKGGAPVTYDAVGELPQIITDFESMRELATSGFKTLQSRKAAVNLVADSQLTHEMLPNEIKDQREVWEALLPRMNLTALIRNLGKMSSIGMFESNISEDTKLVVTKLTNATQLQKSRVHPLQVLTAMLTYGNGRGHLGKLTWTPNAAIRAALEKAFYMSFKFVEPTGKNFMLGIDVSGSMTSPFGDVPGLTSNMVAAAMAMVTLRSEPWCEVYGFGTTLKRIDITPEDKLQDAMRKCQFSFGSTNAGVIIEHAQKKKLPVDMFCIYTDNDINSGSSPSGLLQAFRKSSGRNAKLVSCATSVSNMTIADPSDPGQLDVVGFSADTPQVISLFAKM